MRLLKTLFLWLLPNRRKKIPNPESRTGGVEASRPDKRDFEPGLSSTDILPSNFTLRPSLTRVENQGDYNSCVACAMTTCIETMAKNHGWSNVLELSKMHLWNKARQQTWRDERAFENRGVSIRDAWIVAQKTGVTIEKLFPYTPDYFNKEIDQSWVWQWYPQFRCRFIRLNHDALIKQVLYEDRVPLVVGAKLNRDFLTHDGLSVYKPKDTVYALSHAMVICGWDDDKNAYLLMNSWGNRWGHNGFAWVDKDWLIKSSFDISYCEPQ